MINNKLLVTMLSLVLVAGLGAPAFADSTPNTVPDNTVIPQVLPNDHNPKVIFDNNGAVPDPNSGNDMTQWIQTEDFALSVDKAVTDMHFVMFEFDDAGWDGTLDYFIFADDAGIPGNVLAAGPAADIQSSDLGPGPFGPRTLVWFDLQAPFEADAGVIYHIGLHANVADFVRDDVYWERSTPGFGNTGIESNGGTMDNWFNNSQEHFFELTGFNLVAGEFLPIDTTALMLAGLQTSAIWIIPTLAGLAGTGLYLIKFRTTKVEE